MHPLNVSLFCLVIQQNQLSNSFLKTITNHLQFLQLQLQLRTCNVVTNPPHERILILSPSTIHNSIPTVIACAVTSFPFFSSITCPHLFQQANKNCNSSY